MNQFDFFKKECRKWIKIFGLNNYRYEYRLADLEEEVIAQCSCNLKNEMVLIELNKNWKFVSNKEISYTALHEMLHILLDRLIINGKSRFINEYEIDEAVHEIINRLTNFILG